MKHITIPKFLEPEEISLCLTEIMTMQRDGLFQRYNNPFEQKWFLADKANLPPYVADAFAKLRNGATQWWISHLLDVPITTVDFLHYGGLFVYNNDDYLRAHVDAGIHPKHASLRKVVTALVYLTPAELEFYTGDTCLKEDPLVWSRSYHLHKPGDLVVFTNTDTAWHGVPLVKGHERVVLTVSYLAADFDDSKYKNPRTRAFFCKTLWDRDTPEIRELRHLRASETGREKVYQMGTLS